MDTGVIGIDIGGANTKIATLDRRTAELHYLPLWKDNRLSEVLQEIAGRLKPGKVGVVMTGELADCFHDKEQGIRYIMDAVDAVFPEALYLNYRGDFIDGSGDIRSLAAANWTASALVAGRGKDCIFVDIGSSTTDLIPMQDGRPLAGKTDFQRLGRHELLYRGILRTNVAAMLDRIQLGHSRYRLSSELFALTADVNLLLGNITAEDYTCETADGCGKSLTDAARRLARIVCADTTELGFDKIVDMSRQIYVHQKHELTEAMEIHSLKHGIDNVVGAGLGEFLIRDAALDAGLNCALLSEIYGEAISKVFPAYAVAYLVNDI